jgi:hypothetical protein
MTSSDGGKKTQSGSKVASTRSTRTQSAKGELVRMVTNSGPFRQLRDELNQYPLALFSRICGMHRDRKSPVPDYSLGLAPYMGELSLRALVESELIELVDRDSRSTHAYAPTAKGQEMWERLDAELSKK